MPPHHAGNLPNHLFASICSHVRRVGNTKHLYCVSVPEQLSWGVGRMRDLIGNVRYALRQFRSSPVFTVAAVLTLALGVGGTTAIFTLLDVGIVRSLSGEAPGRLFRGGVGGGWCLDGVPADRRG